MSSTSPSGTPTLLPQASPVENSGLTKVLWFGVIQLAGVAASWAIGYYIAGTVFSSTTSLNLPSNPTPADVSAALGPVFQELSLVVPVVFLMGLIGVVTLTLGFRDLGKVDRQRFSVPSTLMLVLIGGVLVVTAGMVPLFNSIPNVLATVPSTPGTTPSAAFLAAMGSLFLDLVLLGLGGLLVLVGVIGGMILGLWRLGSRYDETLLKVGAIFMIIPLLDIFAPVLILIGAYQAREKLTSARTVVGMTPTPSGTL